MPSFSAEGDNVRLYVLVCVIATLSSHAFECSSFLQVDLYPLLSVSYSCYPTTTRGTMVSRLQSRVVRSVVRVVHGRGTQAGFDDAAILHSEWHEATVLK